MTKQIKKRILGVKRQRKIKKALEKAMLGTEMKYASFSRPNSRGNCNDLPKNEREVTEFIKARIKVYVEMWITAFIKRAIDELDV